MYWRALHRHDDWWLGGKLAALIDVRPGLAAAPLADVAAVSESETDPVPRKCRPAATPRS